MEKQRFKYIYGPVQSWRLGKSLGIDPLSEVAKICNLDCNYCQLGRTHILSNERKVYVHTDEIMREIGELPPIMDIDYFTFSGRGEPTLASNLGEMIKAIKQSKRNNVAVITNSTLMYLSDIRHDLFLSDYVIAKLDACDELSFSEVDKPMGGMSFKRTLRGIKDFREAYRGKFAIQVMFVKKNMKYASRIADIVRDIKPDEVQINTPFRPSGIKPLDYVSMKKIKSYFSGLQTVCVYDYDQEETIPFDEKNTLTRHGNYKKQEGELCTQQRL